MPLVFKALSIKCAFSHFFFWIFLFRFKPANRKSLFIELRSFESLFFSKFRSCCLDESHHLLVKLSCESVYENLWSYKCKICSMLFSANVSAEQGVILAVIVIARFICIRFWRTPTHVQSKPSSDFALRHWLTKSCPVLGRLADICSW